MSGKKLGQCQDDNSRLLGFECQYSDPRLLSISEPSRCRPETNKLPWSSTKTCNNIDAL